MPASITQGTNTVSFQWQVAGLLGGVVEVEFWIFFIVPLMAAVAAIDSVTSFSARLSDGLKLTDDLLIHIAVLLVVFVVYVVWLFAEFDISRAFMTRYYVNPTVDHAFEMAVTRCANHIMDFRMIIRFRSLSRLLVSIKQTEEYYLECLGCGARKYRNYCLDVSTSKTSCRKPKARLVRRHRVERQRYPMHVVASITALVPPKVTKSRGLSQSTRAGDGMNF